MSELAGTAPDPAGVRPVVRTASPGNLGPWLFGFVLLVGGLLLFQALSARRDVAVAVTAVPAGPAGSAIAAPPPLALPLRKDEEFAQDQPPPAAPPSFPSAAPPSIAPPPQVVPRAVDRPVMQPAPMATNPPPAPALAARSSVVIESPRPAERTSSDVPSTDGEGRAAAGRLLNPSLTVPQGVVIAAVLETALDSTRAGGVRAIVSRDVRSFDGSRVLIPRGSRLYGEYDADVASGQKRALIRWRRLTRPDAVIIDLDSPAADPLGRAGVAGRVDTHFFERFGSAILQSVLNIGVGLATRTVTDDAVILALPGSTMQVAGQGQPAQVQPTLRVSQGASVSVFVARDLDFSTVDR